MEPEIEHITLSSPLTLRNALLFPVQSADSRRDILIGSLLLLLPLIGWVFNMGHRIVVVHRMIHGDQHPWPAWICFRDLFKHGMITLSGMVLYLLPATITGFVAYMFGNMFLGAIAGALWIVGVCVIPGYMTAYCTEFNPREVFDIPRSFQRVLHAGPAYWKAWGITITALAFSLLGLLGFGVFFLFTSVWFWQSAAFCFANTMTRASAEMETN